MSCRKLILPVAVALLAVVPATENLAQQTVFLLYYVSSTGSDANACTATAPCATLSRVNRLANVADPDDHACVTVTVIGTFYGQSVNWTHPSPWCSVIISSPGAVWDERTAAVFNGCTSSGTCSNRFFTYQTNAQNHGGEYSNIVLQHLVVTNYANPIWIAGDQADFGNGWNGGNELSYVWFSYIGSYYNASLPEGWGVVNAYASKNDVFDHVSFANVRTADVNGEDMNVYYHAFYLSDAPGTQITNCAMDYVYGDPVRVRNASDNVVVNNCSIKASASSGDPVITEWWCQGDAEECGGRVECPSTGLIVENTYYDGGVAGEPYQLDGILYPAAGCGISISQQAITSTNNTIDYQTWPN